MSKMTIPGWNDHSARALVAVGFLLPAIFLLDLWLPLGVASGVPYVLVVLLGWWLRRVRYIFVLATISTLLTAAGYMLSPEGGISWMAVVNRFEAIFAIWVTALLLALAKRSAGALRRNERLLQAVFDTIPMQVYVKDEAGRYLMVNKEVEKNTGIPAEKFPGKNPMELPCGSEAERAGFAEADRQVLDSGKGVVFPERRFTAADGQQRIRHVIKVPLINDDGHVMGLVGVVNDITGLKQTERTLRESRDELRLITDNVPAIIIYVDREERYRFINKTAENWYGRRASEVIGATIRENLGEEVYRGLEPFVKSALGGEEVGFEHLIQYPDGKGRQIDLIYIPDRGEDGTVKGFFALGNDITERLRAEEALRNSEQRLRATVNHSPSQIILKDLEGRYILVNNQFEELHGISGEEAYGKLPGDIFPEAYAKKVLAQDQEVLQSGRVVERELEVTAADGSTRTMINTKFPVFGADSRIAGVGTITTDVTQRKQMEDKLRSSEERFKAIFDHSPSIIHLKDLDGRYSMVNRTFENMYHRSAREVTGTTSYDLFPKEYADHYVSGDEEVLKTGQPVKRENDLSMPDGSIRKVISHKFPVLDSNGGIIGIGTMDTDVTEFRAIERQLRESQKMEAVGQLAGGIAHEFNNMMQIILNSAHFIREEPHDSGAVLRFVETITNAAGRTADLTRQLLGFSRKSPFELRPLDLNELTSNMMNMIRPAIGEEIQLELRPRSDLYLVEADTVMLEQVILNLCLNARDAMPGGGCIVIESQNFTADQAHCESSGWERPGDYAVLAVSDQGVGMPPEVRDRVFEPFFTTKEVGQGTGLGLAMVYGTVRQHNGYVNVLSEPGKGSTFKIYLPKMESQQPQEDAPVVAPDAPGGNETILIAEDEAHLLDTLSRLLERAGYRVFRARDGKEAVAAFMANADQIDLAILDVVMSNWGGRQVYEQIRETGSNVPVLFSTGYSSKSSDGEYFARLGLKAIQKPYSPKNLLAVVREILDKE